MRHRATAVVLLVGALLTADAPAARAALEASATVEPTDVDAGVSRLAYRLTLKTGDQETHVAVRLQVPTWGRAGDPAGSPVTIDGDPPAVEGPGHIDLLVGRPVVSPVPGLGVCRRGPGPGRISGVKMTLPANSSTTVVVSAAIAPVLWPDGDLRVGFQVAERAAGDLSDPAADAPVILPERPRVTRPVGARIALRVGSVPLDRYFGAIARLGRAVAITGATDPALPGATVAVTALTDRDAVERVATVTADQAGRFSAAWHPRRAGHLRITAAVTPTDPALASDRSCAQSAMITAADGSVRAATTRFGATARVDGIRGRVTGPGTAGVPIACDTAAACRGRLVLRFRGTTVAQRDFLLAPRARAELRLALSRRARDEIRRRGRLRVLAVLFPGRYRHVTLRR